MSALSIFGNGVAIRERDSEGEFHDRCFTQNPFNADWYEERPADMSYKAWKDSLFADAPGSIEINGTRYPRAIFRELGCGFPELIGQILRVDKKEGGLVTATRFDGSNSMVQAAQARGEDATGLCTAREFAEVLLENEPIGPPNRHFPYGTHKGEMFFAHKGKRYNVEMVVTKVEDIKDG